MTDHQHLFWKGKKMEEQKIQKNMPLIDAEKALNFIQTLEYTDEEGILYLEQQLYNLLQKTPNDVNLLVLLLHEQIMHNRGRRARTIAYKIWENGGDLSVVSEQIYIDDLMNLGLSDMAGAALAPYIADINSSIKTHQNLLVKYAVYSGSMPLLSKLLDYLPDTREYNILRDWIVLNRDFGVSNHIPGIMERLIDKVQENMLGFSFNLYNDREFPDVEFVFYVDDGITNYDETKQLLNTQIATYCASHKIEDLINLSVVLYPISRQKKLVIA